MVRHQRIILVSGIPASGKPTYARWLASSKQYIHLDVDFAANWQLPLDVWLESMRQSQNNGIIDWGFPPASIDIVKWIVSEGVEPWWFDGDRTAARQAFSERHERGEHPAELDAFDHQMTQIQAHWAEIEQVFRGRIIRSILAGPTYLDVESLFDEMGL